MIRIENISKRYRYNGRESATILSDINLTIPEGQFVCLLGPSGCGKTTLLNLVAGFIKPSQGRILFNDARVTGPGPERGVVFQDATLFPWLTVLQNVEFGLRQRGLNKNDRTKTATEYLHLVGMALHANAYPHTLSGGMRQ
ncbi:MAG: ATP-binding cassette domain-containing protein, partial [Thermodesulfobacteriota bacterium]|nr:ATP-binding cassette domain-containing protein [Thermodesulfobacteriota bacterium]